MQRVSEFICKWVTVIIYGTERPALESSSLAGRNLFWCSAFLSPSEVQVTGGEPECIRFDTKGPTEEWENSLDRSSAKVRFHHWTIKRKIKGAGNIARWPTRHARTRANPFFPCRSDLLCH